MFTKWYITDDDCSQYMRKYGKNYEMIEYVWLDTTNEDTKNGTHEYAIVKTELNLNDVTDEEVLNVCAIFRCYSTKYVKLYDGVIDLLDTLKAKGKKIFLLSNAQRSFTMNEMNMLGLTPYFDGIFISSDREVSKPNPCFYNGLIEEYGLDKKECVMIGNDYKADINGSKRAGIKSLYIHQSISPEIKGKVNTPYRIMDGNVYKIKELIVK